MFQIKNLFFITSIAFSCLIPFGAFSNVRAQIVNLPTSQTEIQKMVARRPITRTLVLPEIEKIKQVQQILKGKIEPAKTYSLVSPIKLDARNSFIEGKARLYFDWAAEVSAADNIASFDQDGKVQPRLRIFYNATAPGFYIFDFTVENTTFDKPAEFLFQNVLVDFQTKPFEKGLQHQLFSTTIKAPGWYVIALESKTGHWKFNSVEISQFK